MQQEEIRLRASVRRDAQRRRVKERSARGLNSGYLEPDGEGADSEDDGAISLSAIKNKYKKKKGE